MTMMELIDACRNSQSGSITLVSKDKKAPFPRKGFPRAELLCQNSNGETVWLYDAKKLRVSLHRTIAVQMRHVFQKTSVCNCDPTDCKACHDGNHDLCATCTPLATV